MSRRAYLRFDRWRIKTMPLLIALLSFPFFEPFVISMFISNGIKVEFWNVVDGIFTVLRLVIVTFVYGNALLKIANKALKIRKVSLTLMLFLGMQVCACLINDSFTPNMLVGLYSYAGFVLLCEYLMKKSTDDFLRGVMLLFGFATIIGGILILVYPNGFFNAFDKAYAFYAFGSKNSSFYYYYLYLEAMMCWYLAKQNHFPKRFTVTVAFMILTVIVCDSANSIMCITLLYLFFLLGRYGRQIAKHINPAFLCAIIIVLAIVFYVGKNVSAIGALTGILGRNATFTGRDALWADAIKKIASSPVWGTGADSAFLLSYGAEATHAHSFVLDTLAKYGLITFAPYVVALILTIRSIATCKNRPLVFQMGALFFVVNLHMLFDVPTNYFVILMIMIIHAAVDMCKADKRMQSGVKSDEEKREKCYRMCACVDMVRL